MESVVFKILLKLVAKGLKMFICNLHLTGEKPHILTNVE